ncbi:hypothetical protein BGX27_002520, partial [Mortierella sp. AM989]
SFVVVPLALTRQSHVSASNDIWSPVSFPRRQRFCTWTDPLLLRRTPPTTTNMEDTLGNNRKLRNQQFKTLNKAIVDSFYFNHDLRQAIVQQMAGMSADTVREADICIGSITDNRTLTSPVSVARIYTVISPQSGDSLAETETPIMSRNCYATLNS